MTIPEDAPPLPRERVPAPLPDALPDAPHDAPPDRRRHHGLKRNTLGVPSIFFYIIAAASPLTVVIALFPIMISAGNGIGMPGAFVLAAVILMIFAVGYVAMSRHVTNAGAFYAYVTLGLGRVPGLGSAFLATFAYTAIQAGLYGGFGYYASALIDDLTGASVPWWVCAIVAMIACLGLGIQGVHSGAKVLGVFMTLEVTMIVVLSAFGLSGKVTPVSDFSVEPFAPHAVFGAGLGVALMFAHASFIGFEGSAIYSEEARDPKRTIPRATYISVAFMGLLYAASGWLVVNAVGLNEVIGLSDRTGGNFIFAVSDELIGGGVTRIYQILIVTATLAAIVTFHNNVARYLFSLGRQSLLWQPLGWTTARRQTPWVASIVQTASVLIVVVVFAALGQDPFATLFTWATGIGAIAVIASQLLAAVAVLVFFARTKLDDRVWNTRVAPVLAIIGLAVLLTFTLRSLDVLLAVSGGVAVLMVSLVFVAFAGGALYGLYLRATDRTRYEGLTHALADDDSVDHAH